MLSLFLGVLAVVVVQAAAETAERAALDNMELIQGKDGTRQVYIPTDPKVLPLVTETVKGKSGTALVGQGRVTIGEPGVIPINAGGVPFDMPGGGPPPEFIDAEISFACDPRGGCYKMMNPNGGGVQKPKGQAVDLNLTVMSADLMQFKPFRQVAGQWHDFASPPSLAPRLVINKEAAKGLLRHRVPAEMQLEGAKANMTPQIIGVIDDGRSEPMAYARLDEVTNWIEMDDFANRGGLMLMMSPDASGLLQVVESKFRANGVAVEGLHSEVINSKEQVSTQLALIRWVFLGLASLVLLIGVAGILNVGLATVGERIEEFALRRAVGTPRMLLAGIVLAETMLTGLLTAGAAIGIAALVFDQVDRFVPHHLLQNVEFPWQAGVAGVVAGLVAGLLGGLIPAIRAARIPIATVMRA